MRNLSKVEDPDRYYNWYYGYTKLLFPYNEANQRNYVIRTTATSGTIATKYFGDKFNAGKVDISMSTKILVEIPPTVMNKSSTTLLFNLGKPSIMPVVQSVYLILFIKKTI